MTGSKPVTPTIRFHRGDLPADVAFGASVAIDTETLGLDPIATGFPGATVGGRWQRAFGPFAPVNSMRPWLKALLTDPAVLNIFHFARFDVAMLKRYLGVLTGLTPARKLPRNWSGPIPTGMASRICAARLSWR